MHVLSDLTDLTSYHFFLWLILTPGSARCKSSYYIVGRDTLLFLVLSTKNGLVPEREKLNVGYHFLPAVPEC